MPEQSPAPVHFQQLTRLKITSFFVKLCNKPEKLKKTFMAPAGLIRSTPQPPNKQCSFANKNLYGGFTGYLLLSLAHGHNHSAAIL
jgi:hypothetical protein